MLKNVKALWASWAVVHVILVTLVLTTGTTNGDVRYYFRGMNPDLSSADIDAATQMATNSGATPLAEYPHAGVWPLHIVNFISADRQPMFIAVFSAMCVALSGIFLWFLLAWGNDHKAVGRSPLRAGWFWVIFCAATGPILLTRLDIISGMLVAMAIAWMLTRPRVAGFLLAFATLSKLWPGVIAAAFVDRWSLRSTWVRLLSFGSSLVALAVVTLTTVGLDRLLSPITYQDTRGLQVESVMATPFMAARIFDDDKWVTGYAASKSYEIAGPGVSFAIDAADILLLVTVVFAVLFALWRFLYGGWTHENAALFALLLILMLIVTNKVFSPQYVVWMGPAVAVVSLLSSHPLHKLRLVMIITAVFTTLIYPATYEALLRSSSVWPLLYLVIRNLLVVAMTVYVGYRLYITSAIHTAESTYGFRRSKASRPSVRVSS
ncbi:hypothetical protein [Corynebacterium anserum]|uniref:DUF2029 domain-containing protein n=1 Tax=Corynebacterium anserum TaxID=2684406 RepID=A0A7G7YMT4_9CORY|nr:hypothetical protein [Corynebacterium anserum]MBC2681182.1 hypothetical protein [Corynebacterium anserum]QNH95804.1 DUF2029 domain-containing protein [Corynebacterium anserum]